MSNVPFYFHFSVLINVYMRSLNFNDVFLSVSFLYCNLNMITFFLFAFSPVGEDRLILHKFYHIKSHGHSIKAVYSEPLLDLEEQLVIEVKKM